MNKAEIGVFLELSCFFDDPADVGNLISGSSAFSLLVCRNTTGLSFSLFIDAILFYYFLSPASFGLVALISLRYKLDYCFDTFLLF